jgi:adenylate cyclase
MAAEMQERASTLTVKWRRLGYDLGLGIGIAKGFATIGGIGFEGRWDYGAIGTVTNLAARLCGEAKGAARSSSRRVSPPSSKVSRRPRSWRRSPSRDSPDRSPR